MSTGTRYGEARRTHTFCAEDLLHDGDAVSGGLAAAGARTGEDVAALEGERDGLGLDEGRAGEAGVCEGAEEAGVEEVREGGEGRFGVH